MARRQVTSSSPIMQRIVSALERCGQLSRDEIAEEAYCSPATLRTKDYMSKLVSEGLVHISSWRRNSPGRASPIYAAGRGVNAKKPRKITSAERTKAWKKRTQYNRRRADARRIMNQLIEGKAK